MEIDRTFKPDREEFINHSFKSTLKAAFGLDNTQTELEESQRQLDEGWAVYDAKNLKPGETLTDQQFEALKNYDPGAEDAYIEYLDDLRNGRDAQLWELDQFGQRVLRRR